VLHNVLQSGGSRPNKWVRRSRVAINLGQSPRHARSVALVLSLLTGYVFAQFHLKHDDFFETVRDVNAMPQSKWQELAKFTQEEMTGKPLLPSAAKDHKRQVRLEPDHTPINHDITEDPISVQGGHDKPQLPLQQEGRRLDETICHLPSLQSGRTALPSGTTTRSGRASIPPELFMEQVYAVLDDSDAVEDYELQRAAEDPIAFAANGSDPDITLHYNAAMKAHDSEDFKVAMIKEANDHTTRLHWAFWEKQNVPAGHKILSAIWAFKRKRRIDKRAVYKHKARINVHEGQQTYGVNYWETFSPVVNWFSIRLTLVLSLIYQWKTMRQIDFVLAFPQLFVRSIPACSHTLCLLGSVVPTIVNYNDLSRRFTCTPLGSREIPRKRFPPKGKPCLGVQREEMALLC
jgi:hypothetical protein